MARAGLRNVGQESPESPANTASARHLVFSSSFLALDPIGGHSGYIPSKAPQHLWFDTLSQELGCTYPLQSEAISSCQRRFSARRSRHEQIKLDRIQILEEPSEGQDVLR